MGAAGRGHGGVGLVRVPVLAMERHPDAVPGARQRAAVRRRAEDRHRQPQPQRRRRRGPRLSPRLPARRHPGRGVLARARQPRAAAGDGGLDRRPRGRARRRAGAVRAPPVPAGRARGRDGAGRRGRAQHRPLQRRQPDQRRLRAAHRAVRAGAVLPERDVAAAPARGAHRDAGVRNAGVRRRRDLDEPPAARAAARGALARGLRRLSAAPAPPRASPRGSSSRARACARSSSCARRGSRSPAPA